MANYLSQKIDYGQPLNTSAVDLAAKIATLKQQKYDVAEKDIQNSLDQYGIQANSMRGFGKEYTATKLQELTNLVNNSGGDKDLSKSGVKNKIDNMVKSLTSDKTFQNEYSDGIRVQNYQKGIEALKESDIKSGKGQYSQVNDSYARYKGNLESWSNDTTGQARLGSLNYIPYVDESKEFKEFSENLDKYADSVERTRKPDGDGYLYTEKGKKLSADDIKRKVQTLLSDGTKQQMKVNAWATYDQGGTEEDRINNVKSEFTLFKTDELEKLKSEINIEELAVKNGTAKKEDLDNLKTFYTNQEKSFNSMLSEGSKESMYTTMYSERKLNNFANAFAFDNVDTTITSDGTYTANARLQFDIAKNTWDKEYKTKTLTLAQYKAGVNPDGTPNNTNDIQQREDAGYGVDNNPKNLVDKQNELVNSYDGLISSTASKVFQSLDSETQKQVQKRVDDSKGKISMTDVLVEMGDSSNKIVSAKDFKDLKDYRLRQTIARNTLTDYTQKVQNEQNSVIDSEQMVKDLYDDSNSQILLKGKDGKERLYSAKEVIKNNRLVDDKGEVTGKLSTKSGLLEAVKKTVILAKLSKGLLSPNEAQDLRKQLAGISGEDYGVITKNIPLGFEGEDKIADVRVYINESSKTYQLEQQFKKLDGNWSILGLKTVKSYGKALDPEKVKIRVGELMQQDETVSFGKANMVSPKTTSFTKLKALTGLTFDDNTSLKITNIPSQPNMVRISQEQKDNNDGKVAPIATDIEIRYLPAEINSQIDFIASKKFLNIKNLPDLKQPVKYGNIDSRSSIKDIAETHFGGVNGIRLAEQTTEEGALEALFNINPSITGTEDKPTEMGLLIKKVIKDPTLMVYLDKGKSNDAYPTIANSKGTLWKSKDWVDDNNAEQAFNRIQYTPQLIVNGWLGSLIQENKVSKLQDIYGK